jgi:hypothetical protein
LPAEFWTAVPASARWRYLDFGGHVSLERQLTLVASFALVCVILGILPRLACFVSGLILYHLAPLETIIWTPNPYARGLTISVLALLTLAFSPCGDRWTLTRASRTTQAQALGNYTWPIRLMQLFVAQIYFFSGYAKIVHSGGAWASASNLRDWLLYFNEEDQVRVFHTIGMWLAGMPRVCQLIAVGTLVFELGFIVVLFSNTARRLLVPAAALFHLGILLSMNLSFVNVPQLLVFADWDAVATRLRRLSKSGPSASGASSSGTG